MKCVESNLSIQGLSQVWLTNFRYLIFTLGLFFSKLCHPITFRENILIKIHFEESAVKALLHFYTGKFIKTYILAEYCFKTKTC